MNNFINIAHSKKKTIVTSFFMVFGALSLSACQSAMNKEEMAKRANEAAIRASYANNNIQLSERALPTSGSSAVTFARVEHVMIEPGNAGLAKSGLNLDGTGNLETISKSDANENGLNISADLPVKKIDSAALSNLMWAVFDTPDARPNQMEAVGGADIDKGIFADLHFNVGESEILDQDKLKALITRSKWVNGKFFVVGFTDKSGTEKGNIKLAKERATAVEKALLDLGIDKSRIQTKGSGVSYTYIDNAKNRHASVTYIGKEDISSSGNGL